MSAAFDPSSYASQLDAKVARLRELLAPFSAPEPAVFDSPPEHYRLRADFRPWRDAGQRPLATLAPGAKHKATPVDHVPIASRSINAFTLRLQAAWMGNK